VEPLPGLGCQAEWQRGEVGLIGRGAVETRVWTPPIIKVQVAADRSASIGYLRHRRSTHTLSRQAPLPSIQIVMPLVASTLVKAEPVNCEPWSVLKMSGLP
jgi:hypothetical protein